MNSSRSILPSPSFRWGLAIQFRRVFPSIFGRRVRLLCVMAVAAGIACSQVSADPIPIAKWTDGWSYRVLAHDVPGNLGWGPSGSAEELLTGTPVKAYAKASCLSSNSHERENATFWRDFTLSGSPLGWVISDSIQVTGTLTASVSGVSSAFARLSIDGLGEGTILSETSNWKSGVLEFSQYYVQDGNYTASGAFNVDASVYTGGGTASADFWNGDGGFTGRIYADPLNLYVVPSNASVYEGNTGKVTYAVVNDSRVGFTSTSIVPTFDKTLGPDTTDSADVTMEPVTWSYIPPWSTKYVTFDFTTDPTDPPNELPQDFGRTSVKLEVDGQFGSFTNLVTVSGEGYVTVSDVPEPSIALLFGVGVLTICGVRGFCWWQRRATANGS